MAEACSLAHVSYGAAVEHHDDQRLAGGGDGFEHLLLDFGEFDRGAVAAAEAFDLDGHLFAFELGCESDEGDDGIGFAGDGDGLIPLRSMFGRQSIVMPAPKSVALWEYSTRRLCGWVSAKCTVKGFVALERESAGCLES